MTDDGEAAAPAAPPVDVYYYSSTSGQVRLFAERLGRPVHDLAVREVRRSVPTGPWVLVTPSYKTGNDDNDTVPEPVRRFLQDPETRRRLVGVMGSGNRNFGEHYQAAAREIARASGRPMLLEFELQGTRWDVEDAQRILADVDRQVAED
ncbi:protein NrdI [Paraoerskovia sediminicola]|uniref:Protein NrdI n=1 Tax=Paraoerskovia sediminicola TaxID=1138587 RepID=A0ABM8G225_9CELL|nr:class Ib ribonucleoside-diphosphate reductase assembly flavoprotein NrdI [Paraoerskovia sediminicola]BDZ42155.1 protein NrdI [Paraoerskovia sediminicola]